MCVHTANARRRGHPAARLTQQGEDTLLPSEAAPSRLAGCCRQPLLGQQHVVRLAWRFPTPNVKLSGSQRPFAASVATLGVASEAFGTLAGNECDPTVAPVGAPRRDWCACRVHCGDAALVRAAAVGSRRSEAHWAAEPTCRPAYTKSRKRFACAEVRVDPGRHGEVPQEAADEARCATLACRTG
jgi:hypothetical protein